ncbi:hypothetical protein PTKIN_Ptkin09bG0139200 [Pterospermum kingtungense]
MDLSQLILIGVSLLTQPIPQTLSLIPYFELWPASNYGEDIIIGVIDTGVWPKSDSYKDDGMTPVPTRWKANPGIKISMDSGRDTNGHGTYTSFAADGNYVKSGVTFFSYAKGTTRVMAPCSKVVMYKVSWDNEGYSFSFDVLIGMDKAIADGVDVMSISMGFDEVPLYEDATGGGLSFC